MTEIGFKLERKFSNRESWLIAAVEQIKPMFTEIGLDVPDFRIAIGFGPSGAKRENKRILGITLSRFITDDGVAEVWISPEESTAGPMLATVVHEMIHVATDNNNGTKFGAHQGPFAEAAVRLGLEGAMTSTHAGPDLLMKLEMIAASIGEYPGARVDLAKMKSLVKVGPEDDRGSSGGGTQTTRMLKIQCDAGEWSCRASRKMIDMGMPVCPNGHDCHEA